MKAKKGRNRPVSHKPEYETLCAAGTLMLNDDLESIIRMNDIVNAYGLDSISAPCTLAFAVACYENGMLTKAETEGLELRWGNSEDIVIMLEKLARREGFGAVLADGVAKAAERIGRGSEKLAIHIQGQEVPMHDPRYIPALAVSYQMDATPARHTQGFEMIVPPGLDWPDEDRHVYAGKGERYKKLTSLVHTVNCAGLCLFGYECYPIQALPDFLSAVTGWDITLDDCFALGERIGTMRHLFNLREGLNPLDWEVPSLILGRPPVEQGNLRGVTIDNETMINDYLRALDWDSSTTKPSQAKLNELGLAHLAQDL
jgi:aldehyde:ferredoxin oxidoreductase